MAFTRADRKLILFTGGAVVLAALLFAAVIVFAAPNEKPANSGRNALYLGDAADLREKIALSPLYFASPFGEATFWLDKEDGEIAALNIRLPNTKSCNVVWRGRANTYRDCNGDDIQKAELDRYQVTVVQRGNRKGSVYVNLKKSIPAPGLTAASG